jgi:MoaA/NifB/PqqE/SkfB family radical SAM enzyme
MHPDFFSYLSNARSNGINVSVSTNGTLIDDRAAMRAADAGASYVGVSMDGVGAANDDFRGIKGAFAAASRGIEALASRGVRAGIRVTLARPVLPGLRSIFDLASKLPISRICFYHFVPSGRGALDDSLTPDARSERRAIYSILEWAEEINALRRGGPLEILTAGDSSDGVVAYKFLRKLSSERANAACSLLKRSLQAGDGHRILSVRWDGAVFANQFSWDKPLGNWRGLREIAALKPPEARYIGRERCPKPPSAGDAGPRCEWESICRGSLRERCNFFDGARGERF